MTDFAFRGVLPVIETTFHPDGAVDHESFERLVSHVSALPIAGIMFPGFASEFSKLDRVERHALALQVIDGAERNSIGSVLSIPDHATQIAVDEARWAVNQGATALNLLPPFFLSPAASELREHLEAVLRAVPETPVIVQLAPGLTGSALAAEDVVGLARLHANLRAVKVENTPPGRTVSLFGRLEPNLPCLVGYAGLYLPDSLARGAVGVQPGCSVVELYVSLWSFWQSGDIGRFTALHRRMAPYLLEWMQNAEFIVQVEKTISVRRGLISSETCRRPGYRLDATEAAGIDRFLVEFAEELSLA